MNSILSFIERIKAHYADIALALDRQDRRADAMLRENDRLRQRLEELRAWTTIAELREEERHAERT